MEKDIKILKIWWSKNNMDVITNKLEKKIEINEGMILWTFPKCYEQIHRLLEDRIRWTG